MAALVVNVDQLTLFDLADLLQDVLSMKFEARWRDRLCERGWICEPDGTVRRIVDVCETL